MTITRDMTPGEREKAADTMKVISLKNLVTRSWRNEAARAHLMTHYFERNDRTLTLCGKALSGGVEVRTDKNRRAVPWSDLPDSRSAMVTGYFKCPDCRDIVLGRKDVPA